MGASYEGLVRVECGGSAMVGRATGGRTTDGRGAGRGIRVKLVLRRARTSRILETGQQPRASRIMSMEGV